MRNLSQALGIVQDDRGCTVVRNWIPAEGSRAMAESSEQLVGELVSGAAEQLDLPRPLQQLTVDVYEHLGAWMKAELSDRASWHIYPQGSVRLGTAVRPSADADFDVDLVAEWDLDKTAVTQAELKVAVGSAVKGYLGSSSADAPLVPSGHDEWDRCWTLNYNEPFHMDILPAVPDPRRAPTGIWLPDRALFRWQPGDPSGYADWFFSRMRIQLDESRAALAKSANVDVDDIPDGQARTTLQRAVQALKLHRNVYFAGNAALAPSSIVITTLAALSYTGSGSLYDVLMHAAATMPALIDREGEETTVLNPVNDEENFADSWTPEHLAACVRWLGDVQSALEGSVKVRAGLDQLVEVLEKSFGGTIRESAHRYGEAQSGARSTGQLRVASSGLVGGATGLTVRQHTFHGA